MKIFKCGLCKEKIVAKLENQEGIVYFDEKYWHKDCFVQECQRRLENGRSKKYDWQFALDNITEWQVQATANLKLAAEKDNMYNFIVSHYCISMTSKELCTKLNEIYNGNYKGLAYPISPSELLNEWEYYLPQLNEARKNKDMSGSQAVSYDIAILLTRNAEYREIMVKRQVEEQVRAAQEHTTTQLNEEALSIMRRNNSQKQITAAKRRADLFREVMGYGN